MEMDENGNDHAALHGGDRPTDHLMRGDQRCSKILAQSQTLRRRSIQRRRPATPFNPPPKSRVQLAVTCFHWSRIHSHLFLSSARQEMSAAEGEEAAPRGVSILIPKSTSTPNMKYTFN
ncbi:hypothetical protein CLAIMM_12648 isoform 2 [Cladophialophora immunda]|nr:hypothetical protein CLAIMM_12648 isoform 1 [Cladophialophora immunda]OQV08362.1 hypothetical protein CLAIMM_12648 isoform 2 [Cladophialophora immunda]